MDNVVYVDAMEKELDLILDGDKKMIIRGASGRKLPYGRIFEGDELYFIENNGDNLIKAKATVKSVYNSDKMSYKESINLIVRNQSLLKLTNKQFKKFAGKRYLVLIEIKDPEALEPFEIDKSNYSNMDDWFNVEKIDLVKIE
jgi:hypothetical protein